MLWKLLKGTILGLLGFGLLSLASFLQETQGLTPMISFFYFVGGTCIFLAVFWYVLDFVQWLTQGCPPGGPK